MMNIKLIPFLTLLFLSTNCLQAMDTPRNNSEIQIVSSSPAANPHKRLSEECSQENAQKRTYVSLENSELVGPNCPVCSFSSDDPNILEDHIHIKHTHARTQPYVCDKKDCSVETMNLDVFKRHIKKYHGKEEKTALNIYINACLKKRKRRAVNRFLQKYEQQTKAHEQTQNGELHGDTAVPLAQEVDKASQIQGIEAELSAQLSEPTPTQSPAIAIPEQPRMREEQLIVPTPREPYVCTAKNLELVGPNCPVCSFSSEHMTTLEDHICSKHTPLLSQPYTCSLEGCSSATFKIENFKSHIKNYHGCKDKRELTSYIEEYLKNRKTKAIRELLQKKYEDTQTRPAASVSLKTKETQGSQLPTPIPLASEVDEAILMEDLEAELSAQLSEATPTQSPVLATLEQPYIHEEHRTIPERREFLEAESQLMRVRAAAQRYSGFPNPPENMQTIGEPLPMLLPSLAASLHQPLQQVGSPYPAPIAKVPSIGIIGVEELKKKVHDQEKAEKKLLHEGLIFKCSKCGNIQKNLPTLKQHILEHHTQLKQLECDIPGCNFGSNFYAPFSKHMKNAHKKESDTKLSLEKQRKIADELRPYLSGCEFECDTCGALFESKKAVSSHKTYTHNTMKNK